MSFTDLNEQEIVRRNTLEDLRKLNINPYPPEEYHVNCTTQQIFEEFEPEKNNFQEVSMAGRIMSRRIMGKASFAEIQDETGRLQLYFNRDEICQGDDKTMYNDVFKRLIDIGDIIGVKGHAFVTQVGEKSIMVKEFVLLSKSLRPLPIVKEKDGQVYDAFTDPEQRYRQRYVDLIVNPQNREIFIKRAKIISTMRQIFDTEGYLEVETPILQSIPGGATARPFITHHNALNIDLYLRIANELYLKRLIVGGYNGVYEFAKDFRNEGMDRTHNPEFTVMEIYVAYKDYFWMMKFVEQTLEKVAIAVNGTTKVKSGDNELDFKAPYKRITMYDAIKQYTGYDISGKSEDEIRKICNQLGIKNDATMGKGKLIDEIFGEKCEHNFIQPTFITDYPEEMSPLTKKHRTVDGLTERFELMINGKEICNAYSELNDPIDQLDRFKKQLELSEKGDDEAMFIDQNFVQALEYGMPPTSGLGIGIDRLTMMLTNQSSIQEVLLFPQMRHEKKIEIDDPQLFITKGVPEEWISVIQKAGFTTVESMRTSNPNKLHQLLCGANKKFKLELKNPTIEEVTNWLV